MIPLTALISASFQQAAGSAPNIQVRVVNSSGNELAISTTTFDMVQGQRERDSLHFQELNPDAPPEAYDRMQQMQDDMWNNLQ
jgi:hypothetical protein